MERYFRAVLIILLMFTFIGLDDSNRVMTTFSQLFR
jgi:hypothetical protein